MKHPLHAIAAGLMSSLLLGLLGGAAQAAADSPLSAEPTHQATAWTVTWGGRKVMVYAFAPQKFKPYVKELATIDGFNLLRDAPFDHLHHHALMYGIKVNGVNFWEETPGCGVQKPVRTVKPEFGRSPEGRPRAVIRQTIHWVGPLEAFLPDTTKAALLVEERTLILTVDEAQKEVALEWQADFAVGGQTNQVILTGANYHGLGLRFLQELDPLAVHLNAGSKPDLSGNKQDVSSHRWGSVFFNPPAGPATVAVFGHPDNVRGDATFFTMKTPFAYLAATQGLDREPLVYRGGQKFTVKYLIALYPEPKSPEALHARGQQWAGPKR